MLGGKRSGNPSQSEQKRLLSDNQDSVGRTPRLVQSRYRALQQRKTSSRSFRNITQMPPIGDELSNIALVLKEGEWTEHSNSTKQSDRIIWPSRLKPGMLVRVSVPVPLLTERLTWGRCHSKPTSELEDPND